MKYLFYPIARAVVVLISWITIYPLIFIFGVLIRTLWNFKPISNWKWVVTYLIEANWHEEEYILFNQKQYYVYPTAWDYIIGKRTYIDNPDYVEPDKKTKKITAKQVKQKVQDTLDDIKL